MFWSDPEADFDSRLLVLVEEVYCRRCENDTDSLVIVVEENGTGFVLIACDNLVDSFESVWFDEFRNGRINGLLEELLGQVQDNVPILLCPYFKL